MFMPGAPVRESLPDARLTDHEGRRISLREAKRLKQAAVFLFHGGSCSVCRRKLGEFAAAARRYAEIPAAVIAVPLDGKTDLAALVRELGLDFILAMDADGALIDRFAPADPRTGERTPCCIVADAWGDVYTVLRGEDAVEQSAILEWMEFIDVQCPECGVPEW